MTTLPPRALILLAILTLVWGTNWPLFAYALREISIWTFRAATMLVAGAVLLAVSRALGQADSRPGFTMPLWAALISWALLGERLTGRMLLAIGFGAGAVGLLMLRGVDAYARARLGFARGLVAGIGWAGGTLLLKRRPVGVPATVLTGWQLLIGAIPIGAVALVVGDRHWFVPTASSLLVIGYITLVPMALGNACWFAIVGMLPANVAGLSSILVPVVAMLSGAVGT
ncbi:MAG: DMT family transporter [Burkholderiales bacterium]|nr:DMT family transporter [Burkholderiales bacterium]